jgi:hypothetical protein
MDSSCVNDALDAACINPLLLRAIWNDVAAGVWCDTAAACFDQFALHYAQRDHPTHVYVRMSLNWREGKWRDAMCVTKKKWAQLFARNPCIQLGNVMGKHSAVEAQLSDMEIKIVRNEFVVEQHIDDYSRVLQIIRDAQRLERLERLERDAETSDSEEHASDSEEHASDAVMQ